MPELNPKLSPQDVISLVKVTQQMRQRPKNDLANTNGLPQTQTRFKSPSQPDVNRIPLHSLEGTIQRVNYRTRELRLIAEGRPFQFSLSADCRLWFNGRIAPFRCFQPLDHIRVHFVYDASKVTAEELYLWEDEPIF